MISGWVKFSLAALHKWRVDEGVPGTRREGRITRYKQRDREEEQEKQEQAERWKKKSNNTRLSLRNCLGAMPIYLYKKLAACAECVEDLGIISHQLENSVAACFIFSHPGMKYRSLQGLEINISVFPQETLQLANNCNCIITI